MQLLIVDDESNSIEAIYSMIDQEALGITHIYTALSTDEARAILKEVAIDILLSDIEMPQEDGLAFVTWLHEEGRDIECLFITCYAEFAYAQQAVSLGSLAYILKPVHKAKLEKELSYAIEKVKEKKKVAEENAFIQKNKAMIYPSFWLDLFRGDISSQKQDLLTYITAKKLQFAKDGWYCPLLLVTKDWKAIPSEERKLFRFALKNIASELFATASLALTKPCDSVWIGEDSQLIILAFDRASDKDEGAIKRLCQNYLEQANAYIAITTCAYIGSSCQLWEVAEQIEKLIELDYNNLQRQGLTVLVQKVEVTHLEVEQVYFIKWGQQLEDDAFAKVNRDIHLYIHNHKSEVKRVWLEKFCVQYLVMLATYANKHRKLLSQIFYDEKALQLQKRAERSLEDLRLWVQYSLEALEQLTQIENHDPIALTLQYIEANLSEELDMKSIAAHVHLNPDYLTRIFKKKMGISVNKYVVKRKMEKAKNLLQATDLMLSEIAYQVGYYNYASFNRVFTKLVGMAPQLYRTSTPR